MLRWCGRVVWSLELRFLIELFTFLARGLQVAQRSLVWGCLGYPRNSSGNLNSLAFSQLDRTLEWSDVHPENGWGVEGFVFTEHLTNCAQISKVLFVQRSQS